MNTFTHILPWIQIAVSLLLIISILLQQSGAGIGGALGGGDGGSNYRTLRGFEKFLFYLTIVIAVVFAGLAVTAVLVQ
jgi:protein translocase SecG subunit